MKKILLIICLLLNHRFSFSQEFNGFGEIRIGISENDFKSNIYKEINKKVVVVNEKNIKQIEKEWTNFLLSDTEEPKVYNLKYKEGSSTLPIQLINSFTRKILSLSDSINIYFIPLYHFGEINLKNLFLSFKEDRLQLIELEPNINLWKAALQKYKPTKQFDSSYNISCTYIISGVKEEKFAFRHISIWNYNDKTAEACRIFDYDSDCKINTIYYLRFLTNTFKKYIDDYEENIKNKEKNLEKKKQKSILEKI